ncbi:MAG: hypothetical protein QW666_02500 [Candidatus Woesearchaeota archaeon]
MISAKNSRSNQAIQKFSDILKTDQTWIAYREQVFNPFPECLER